MGFRKKFAAATISIALAALAFASVSSADPTGEFAPFIQCPYNNPEVEHCVYWEIDTAYLTLGERSIPWVNPGALFQGGYSGEGPGTQFFGAKNNKTLITAPQPVSGGLGGLTPPGAWPEGLKKAFNKMVEEGLTGVNATVELAQPASSIGLNMENLLIEEGTALALPVKIKLENIFLGNNCFIGAEGEPVQIDFTTGESGSLIGSTGSVSFNPGLTLMTAEGLELVDGAVDAPGASGCGGVASAFVDPFVDSIFGLPSEENTAVWEGTFEDASAEAVDASDP